MPIYRPPVDVPISRLISQFAYLHVTSDASDASDAKITTILIYFPDIMLIHAQNVTTCEIHQQGAMHRRHTTAYEIDIALTLISREYLMQVMQLIQML